MVNLLCVAVRATVYRLNCTCFIFVSGLTGFDLDELESPLLDESDESELGVELLHSLRGVNCP